MAFAARFLSRSRKLYAGQIVPRHINGVPSRYFANAAGAPMRKGDQMLKNIFLEVKNKFEAAMSVLKKEKITIDPNDPAAVAQYVKVMKTVREKASLLSESQRIQHAIKTKTQGIPDVRAYLLALKEIRIEEGVDDELGAEPVMMAALDKIEKELKKPLLRSDKKGMSLLTVEFDKINKKLGIRKEDMPKYEQEYELEMAKADLEELEKDALEAMETQARRDEFKDEKVVPVKSLDIRNFL